MKNKLILTLLSLLVCFVLKSQDLPLPAPILSAGWDRIYIKDVGYFDLPPTMEVQSGKYKEFVNQSKRVKGYDATELTAQQKGLNAFDESGFERYARVMLETNIGKLDDYEELDFDITDFDAEEITELSAVFKEEIINGFRGTGLKLIEWYPLKVEQINGMSCIHIAYKRQLKTNPFVLVNIYMFFNNDRTHTLTLSYREAESSYWKSDFNKILNSFRITNIRE